MPLLRRPATAGRGVLAVAAAQVAAGFPGQPGIGGQVFLPQPDVLVQVAGGVRVHDVAQVITVDAGAPGVAAKGQRDVPDLPAFAVLGAEGGGLVPGCVHRSPRSVSASSIACRNPSGVIARTTRGGLVRGRRAYTTPASTPGQ